MTAEMTDYYQLTAVESPAMNPLILALKWILLDTNHLP